MEDKEVYNLLANCKEDCQREQKSTISTGLFTWVVGLIVAIGMASMSFLYARSVTNSDKIEAVAKELNRTNIDSAKIQEQLATIQRDLIDIKLSLKTHDNK